MIAQFQDIDLFPTRAIVIGRVGVLATKPDESQEIKERPG
jgi:hypothetical protein